MNVCKRCGHKCGNKSDYCYLCNRVLARERENKRENIERLLREAFGELVK